MGVVCKKTFFRKMKLSDSSRGCNVGTLIPVPAERLMKSALMIRQSSFSKLINKKFPNGKYLSILQQDRKIINTYAN